MTDSAMPPETGPGEPGPRSPRRLRLLLAASLGLNLIVIGIVAGVLIRGPSHGEPPLTVFNLRHVLGDIPKEDRGVLRAVFKDMRGELKPLFAAIRADRQRLVALLRAEAVDEAALREVLASQSARVAASLARTNDRLIVALVGMAPDARLRFAAALEKAPRQGRPRSD